MHTHCHERQEPKRVFHTDSRALGAGAVLLACLAVAPRSLAWSSHTYPFFENVHNLAIEKVLGKKRPDKNPLVNDDYIAILEEEQTLADQDQAPAGSDKHAMAGLERAEHDHDAQKEEYRKKTDTLIRSNLARAIKERKAGHIPTSFHYLGKAIHAMEDATSPAHQHFQIWSFNETWKQMADHVFAERSYPEANAPGSYLSRLQGAVEYAYRIYLGEEPLRPENFFTPLPDGMLIIPPKFLHP